MDIYREAFSGLDNIIQFTKRNTSETIGAERLEINNFLTKWKDAWERKDIEGYIFAYSKKFRSKGMDLKGWRIYKEGLNKRYLYIDVKIEDIKILKYKDYVVVTFIQDYRSSGFNDQGVKRLYLKKEEDGWKILGEEWKVMPTKNPDVIANYYKNFYYCLCCYCGNSR